MINNTSNSFPALLIDSTPDGLRHRRKTDQDQPVAQIANTEKKMETGLTYAHYRKINTKEMSAFAVLGAGVGLAAATISGASLPLIAGATIGYSISAAVSAKAGSETGIKTRQMLSGVKCLKYKLE